MPQSSTCTFTGDHAGAPLSTKIPPASLKLELNKSSFKLLYIASSPGISRKFICISALLCQQPGTAAASQGEAWSLCSHHQLSQHHHKMVLCCNRQGGRSDRPLHCSAQVTSTIHTTSLSMGFDWATQSLLQTKGMRQVLLWSTQHVRRQKSDGIWEETNKKAFFSRSQNRSAALGNTMLN